MVQKTHKPGRRGFLRGIFTGLGVAALAGATQGREDPRKAQTEAKTKAPILYRRTAETERYYKTLYS